MSETPTPDEPGNAPTLVRALRAELARRVEADLLECLTPTELLEIVRCVRELGQAEHEHEQPTRERGEIGEVLDELEGLEGVGPGAPHRGRIAGADPELAEDLDALASELPPIDPCDCDECRALEAEVAARKVAPGPTSAAPPGGP